MPLPVLAPLVLASPVQAPSAAPPALKLPVPYARAPAPLPPGIARTSVEGKVGDGVLSSGVLCGIQPSADTSGAARARGFDPDGKFVGAKMAFRF